MSTRPSLIHTGASAKSTAPLEIEQRSTHIHAAMGWLFIVMVIAAFGDRYFARAWTDSAPPLPLFVHVHALLFIGWIVLFTTQATLAAKRHLGAHRQLGFASLALAILIVVVGVYSAIEGARRGHNPGGAPNALVFMIVGVTDIVLFAGFFLAAFLLRKQHELHKRLMLFATLGGFLWPTVVRLPFIPFLRALPEPSGFVALLAFTAVVLLIPLVANWTARRRVHWLDVFGAGVILGSIPLRSSIGLTDAWQRFAAWLVG